MRCIRYAALKEELPNWSAAEYVCGGAGWPYDAALVFRIRLIIRHEKIKIGWREAKGEHKGIKYQYPSN